MANITLNYKGLTGKRGTVTTDAGGGVNGPKHPADIRVKDQGGYA